MSKKKTIDKTVLSCSRRTDVPAFYYRWLQKALADGFVVWPNLYNNRDYTISLKPEETHSMVLWSKNFANVIADPGLLTNYNLFFQFTLTGYGLPLEPHVPSIDVSLLQMEQLVKAYSPQQINWRYDPLVFLKNGDPVEERVETFEQLAKYISSLGIGTCTLSYATFYPDVIKRMQDRQLEYFDFDDDFKVMLSTRFSKIAKENNIQIYSCCAPVLEKNPDILRGSCVDGKLLEKLFGGNVSHAKDASQRVGCGCSKSRDIGSYQQKCSHGCEFCYSTPFHV